MYPKTPGPYQIMYQASYEEWFAIALAYTWPQVDEILKALVVEKEGYDISYVFVKSLNKHAKGREYWVDIVTEDPLTFNYYVPDVIRHG